MAHNGATRWTGEDAANGTTLKKNDAAVARIHAKQLFDAEGLPIVRVMDDGTIATRAGVVVRRAVASPNGVTIGDLTVTNTTDLALAAMLTAREAEPELRALAACHFLLGR